MRLGLCRVPKCADVLETVAKAFPCQSCADVLETVAEALPCQSCADVPETVAEAFPCQSCVDVSGEQTVGSRLRLAVS